MRICTLAKYVLTVDDSAGFEGGRTEDTLRSGPLPFYAQEHPSGLGPVSLDLFSPWK